MSDIWTRQVSLRKKHKTSSSYTQHRSSQLRWLFSIAAPHSDFDSGSVWSYPPSYEPGGVFGAYLPSLADIATRKGRSQWAPLWPITECKRSNPHFFALKYKHWPCANDFSLIPTPVSVLGALRSINSWVVTAVDSVWLLWKSGRDSAAQRVEQHVNFTTEAPSDYLNFRTATTKISVVVVLVLESLRRKEKNRWRRQWQKRWLDTLSHFCCFTPMILYMLIRGIWMHSGVSLHH